MIPDAYFDRFDTAKYQNRNPIQRRLIRQFVSKFHSLFLAANPVKRVLEVGVGEGFLSGYLSEKLPHVDFTGVDLSAADIERLGTKFPRIKGYVGSVYDLSFLEGEFDLVICAEVLEHLEEPQRGIEELLARKPKHLILTVPHEPFFMASNFLRGKNVTRFGNDIEHVNHYGRRSFRRLLDPYVKIERMETSYPWLMTLSVPR